MKPDLYFKAVMDADDFNKIAQITTINELLCLMENYQNLPAIESLGQAKSYQELLNDISLTRGFFIENNFKPGTHIGLCLKNEYDFVRLFLAITSLGMVAVILPIHVFKTNLEAVFKKMDLVTIIHDQKIIPLDIPLIEKKLVTSNTPTKVNQKVNQNTPATIIFTSGTTNQPRGAVLSHGNLMRGTINGAYGYQKTYYQKYYAIIPFSHVFGLIRSCLTPLYTGSSVFMCEEMADLVKNFSIAKPTIVVLVPALAEMVYSLIKIRGLEAVGGNLKTIICGGAPVSPSLSTLFLEQGINLFPGYGLTESSNLVSGSTSSKTNPHTVGKIYPFLETKVVAGELWIKGDAVMLGYYQDPVANQTAFHEGWFRTGDLVRFDEAGFLYIIGRLKNVIVLSNGENVSPEMLEEELKTIPFVKDALVSSKKTGISEVIIAEVFFDHSIIAKLKIVDPEKVFKESLEKINEKFPPFMQIRQTSVRTTDFSRSASLKIIREAQK